MYYKGELALLTSFFFYYSIHSALLIKISDVLKLHLLLHTNVNH